jgi:hypothetical protein
MDINEKVRTSKTLIFIAWVIMVLLDLFLVGLEYFNFYYPQNIPVAIGCIVAAILMWYGLWLGSRGIGIPLSIGLFLNLLFGYPCWIPFSILLLLNVVIPTLFW